MEDKEFFTSFLKPVSFSSANVLVIEVEDNVTTGGIKIGMSNRIKSPSAGEGIFLLDSLFVRGKVTTGGDVSCGASHISQFLQES